MQKDIVMTRCDRSTASLRAAALVAALALLASACGTESQPAAAAPEERPIVLGPRDVAAATRTAISAGIVLTGSLNPYRQVDVRAQVPGVVGGMSVDRGESVRAGQVMATIEAAGIRSQAASADAQIAGAQSAVALARRQLESSEMLYERGAVSRLEFETARTQLEAAEAQLAATRAQAASARESAARTAIEAPIDGQISRRSVSEGEAVLPGQTLFTIVNTSLLELAGQAPVDEAARVKVGMPVEFTLDAYPDRTFRGSVARVDPTADPATRQVGVFVQLPNADHQLVGGLFATGRILTGSERQAIVVPEDALRSGGSSSYVWTIRDDAVTRTVVETGTRDRGRGLVEITSGLAEGAQVITGPGDIREGARVEIQLPRSRAVPPDPAATTSAAAEHRKGGRA